MSAKPLTAWEARALANFQGDTTNAPNLEQALKDIEKRAKEGHSSHECKFDCSDEHASLLCVALQTLGYSREWYRDEQGKAVVKIGSSGI